MRYFDDINVGDRMELGTHIFTADDIKTFAARQLTPESMTVIVVGRGKDCEKPLRELFPTLRVVPQAKVDLDSPTLVKAKR